MVINQKKSWLLIGTGKIANHYAFALNHLFKNDDFYVIPSSYKSESYFNFSKKYSNFLRIDYENINNFENLIPIICTPVNSHVQIIRKLLSKNINKIYCEKPLSLDSDEIKLLQKHSDKIFVLFNRRFYELQIYLNEYLKKALYVNAKITISRAETNFKESFIPHFLDFILYNFPNELPNINQSQITSNFNFISYISNHNNNIKIPINISIIEASTIPCSIEVMLSDQSILNFNTLEKMYITKYDFSKNSFFTNQIFEKEKIFLEEKNYSLNKIKYGFVKLLHAMRDGNVKNMHNLTDALTISNLINKI